MTEEATWPTDITVQSTGKCNLRCVMCDHATAPNETFYHYRGDMEKTRELVFHAQRVALHGVGEPLSCPFLWDLIPKGHEAAIGFVTNGLLLTEENCHRVIENRLAWLDFSIDAGSAATYRKIRGGNWETLWRNIDRLIEIRDALFATRSSSSGRMGMESPKPDLQANMVLMRENIGEAAALIPYLSKRKFKHLHLYHMNPDNDYAVPWRDGTNGFEYQRQVATGHEFKHEHDEAVRLAMRTARNFKLPLLVSGEFLGESGDYRRIA